MERASPYLADIFDGLVIDSRTGPGGYRFADASQVEGLYRRGAVLALDTAACERLPAPSESPAVLEADPTTRRPTTSATSSSAPGT